jgi:hypothetical protein
MRDDAPAARTIADVTTAKLRFERPRADHRFADRRRVLSL